MIKRSVKEKKEREGPKTIEIDRKRDRFYQIFLGHRK